MHWDIAEGPLFVVVDAGAKCLAVFCWLLTISVMVAAVGAFVSVESIVAFGPAMAVLGLITALLSIRWNSLNLILLGLGSAMITSEISLMIAGFHWSPDEAKYPVQGVLTMSAIVYVFWGPWSAWQVIQVHSTPGVDRNSNASSGFRFSILSLLVLITITGLLIRLLQLIQLGNEMSLFTAYGMSILLLSVALFAWYFYRLRQQRRQRRQEPATESVNANPL